MPEISRFLGIGGEHSLPHFHAYYQGYVAVYAIEPVGLLAGDLPIRQRRFVEAWAEMHQEQLMDDWVRLQSGKKAVPIVPLQ